MAHSYASDHVFVAATYVRLSPGLAKQAVRRGAIRITEGTKVDILDVVCLQCRRPFDAVDGEPCAAAHKDTRTHLAGGPGDERKKRKHHREVGVHVDGGQAATG